MDEVKSIMKKMNPLSFELEGEKVTKGKFSRAVKSFFDLVDEISKGVTQKTKPFNWYVSVDHSCIVLNLSPEAKEDEDREKIPTVLSSIRDGIEIINNEEKRPKYYSDEALKSLRDLASMIEIDGKGIKKIKVSINGKKREVSTKAIGNIDTLFKTPKTAFGSIEGKLQMISDRGGLHVTIYESLSDRAVKCIFKEDMLDDIVKSFRKRIYAFGIIAYQEEEKPQSIEIKEIKIFPDQDKLPKAKDVLGILEG